MPYCDCCHQDVEKVIPYDTVEGIQFNMCLDCLEELDTFIDKLKERL